MVALFRVFCVLMVAMAISSSLWADFRSTTGEILLDTNIDGNAEATLNATGLGIGTTPSANLHVSGNVIITGNLAIGSASASSNLSVSGSLGFSVQSVDSSTTLSGNSLILANSSSNDIILTLPTASSVTGRIYTIKKASILNNIVIRSNENIDSSQSILMSSLDSNLPSVKVMSSGTQWYLLSADGISNDITNGLAAWWTFNASSGTSATDSINGLSGTLTNMAGTEWTSGWIGNGLHFDGTDDYVTVPDNAIIGDNLSSAMTVMLWFRPDTDLSNTGRMLEKGSDYYLTSNNGLGIQFIVKTPSVYTTNFGATFGSDRWYHVAGVFDGVSQNIYLYVEGRLESTVNTGSSTITDNNLPLQIGSDNGTSYFDGTIDDVRLYNRALSATEIKSVYDTYTSASNSLLLAHFEMNDATGTILDDTSYLNKDGTASVTFTSVAGKVGNAIDLNSNVKIDGGSSYTYVPKRNAHFSVAFWFNPDTIDAGNGNDRMFTIQDGVNTSALILGVGQSGNVQEFIGTTYQNWSTTIISGTWYHLAFVFEDGSISRYIDGSLIETATRTMDNPTVNSIVIGGRQGGNYYDGKMDDLRIYGKGLSASEVLALYQLGQ